ncbi:hypothetical protein Hamer_G016202, partial [Homarus americanus]
VWGLFFLVSIFVFLAVFLLQWGRSTLQHPDPHKGGRGESAERLTERPEEVSLLTLASTSALWTLSATLAQCESLVLKTQYECVLS